MKRSSETRSGSASPAVRILSLILVLALALVFPASIAAENARPSVRGFDEAAVVGTNIASFSTHDVFGNAVNGSVLGSRQLTVLHYFATWSPECIEEMSYMQTLCDSYAPDEVAVYGLLFEDATSTPEACVELMLDSGFTYNVLRLDSVLSALVSEYAMIPQTFLVDSNGTVIEHYAGCLESYAQLESMVENQLGHPGEYCMITFIDGLTNEVIANVAVAHGGSTVPPAPPEHPGYLFSGWEGNYQNVTENTTVIAIYIIDPNYFAPGDVDMDHDITIGDALMVLRYSMGIFISEGVELYGDMDGSGAVDVTDALLILRVAIGVA
jgi:AhpC/TSA family.